MKMKANPSNLIQTFSHINETIDKEQPIDGDAIMLTSNNSDQMDNATKNIGREIATRYLQINTISLSLDSLITYAYGYQ